MNRIRRFTTVAMLLVLISCDNPRAPSARHLIRADLPPAIMAPNVLVPASADEPETTEVEHRYTCDRVEARVRGDGRRWHTRVSGPWTKDDRERFRGLVTMVAGELGADPGLLTLWSMRESTNNPYAIHVLNPDREAAEKTWAAHRWDPVRAAELAAEIEADPASAGGYWGPRAQLARIERYRGNRYYYAEVEYEVVDSSGSRGLDSASAWSYGYGPFGMNPTYYLQKWDADAPPWVFCEDDGLAAIVTAIWAARDHQRECERQGFGDSNEVVNRRFSSGHCEPRKRDDMFRERASKRGLDPDKRARLGKRWPAESSDRVEVIEHLRAVAMERDLLSNR